MIQVVKIEDAVGYPLAHDITEIRPGEFKGPAFLKGQILKRKDLDHLRRLGKNHLYILKSEKDELHEDEAAVLLANSLCGKGIGWKGDPREGKISLRAMIDGLLKVDVNALERFNTSEEVMCASMHTNSVVKADQQVAATRAIPLVIKRSKVENAVAIAHTADKGVFQVLQMKKARAGVMITGDEVFYGRIEDKFEVVLREKIARYGGEILDLAFLPDDDSEISRTAVDMVQKGAEVIISSGGMSVDPDDRTRYALKKAGAKDIVYGSSVLPGAMFLVAYLNEVPILGIPACGMYAANTIFDLIYPRVLAGEKITRREIARLGHGGLCQKCKVCRFPNCTFGKSY